MSDHINYVCKKLNYTMYSIRCLKAIFNDIEPLLNVYYAYAYSAMSYNVAIWGSSSNCKRILILQKRIIRLILGLGRTESCRPHFINFKLLTFPAIYIYESCKFVKQNLSDFTHNRDVHGHNTRQANDLHVSKNRLTLYNKGPLGASTKLFNKLPLSVKNIDSFHIFKRNLREFLVNKCFYSISEYLSF